MGSLFGGSKRASVQRVAPAPPPPDPELARLREENKKAAEQEKERLEAAEKEEKDAVNRRLRGSRSLFTSGQQGFQTETKKKLPFDEDDELQDTLG